VTVTLFVLFTFIHVIYSSLFMFIHVHLFTSLRKSASFKLSTVKENPLRGLTCRRFDRKCDGHTDTGKFIFCPCIALDRQ